MLLQPLKRNPWKPLPVAVQQRLLVAWQRIRTEKKFFLTKTVYPWATLWELFQGATFTTQKGRTYPIEWCSGDAQSKYTVYAVLGTVRLGPLGDAHVLVRKKKAKILEQVYALAEEYLEQHPLDKSTEDIFGLSQIERDVLLHSVRTQTDDNR